MLTDIFARVARDLFKTDGDRTPLQNLRRTTFSEAGRRFVAIEQNQSTSSRWAQLARQGKQVVQFKDETTNKYVAVSVNGQVTLY